MGLIRRILSHGFLLLLILGAAIVYYYRADIFPGAGEQHSASSAAENDADAVVTVQSAAELAAEQAGESTATGMQASAENAASGAPDRSQTYFGGGQSVQASTAQETGADLSKYRPLTPEETAGDEEAPDAEEVASDATTQGQGPAVSQQAQEDTPDSIGVTAKSETQAKPSTGSAVSNRVEPGEDTQAGRQGRPEYRPLTPEETAGGEEVSGTEEVATATTTQGQDPAVSQQAQEETPDSIGVTAKSETQAQPSARSAVSHRSEPGMQSPPVSPEPPKPQLPPPVASAGQGMQPPQAGPQPGASPQRPVPRTGIGMPPEFPAARPPLPRRLPPPAPVQQAEPSAEEKQLITSARQAFWQRDYEQAIKDYQALAELQADNPDPYGELGNVYYSAGQWNKAAEMYVQAGERLIKQGDYRRAMHLVSVLRGLDTRRAAALDKVLEDALPKTAAEE